MTIVKTITSENLPIHLWLEELDPETLQQAKNIANFPFASHHIAIMPDAHMGYGMPIGGVMATDGVVIPNGVGVDIGCGVCAVQSSLPSVERKNLKNIITVIRNHIPLGFKHRENALPTELMPQWSNQALVNELPIAHREYESARKQLGTLGGGNHFIEIQEGDDGYVWIMIHSGSRNIGYQVANHYNNIAKEFNNNHKRLVPSKHQLDYLPLHSKNGQHYLKEMRFCVEFAAKNRQQMMAVAKTAFLKAEPGTTFSPPIDIAHNYASEEIHFGKNVVVHRKGATRAKSGELGIIPGSQGSVSFIVKGLGNADSFTSCSHGAGRKLGRKQAQRQLNFKEEVLFLEKQNILHSIRRKKDLDEAAGAYKDIRKVIDNQSDLVEVITSLRPLAVIKG